MAVNFLQSLVCSIISDRDLHDFSLLCHPSYAVVVDLPHDWLEKPYYSHELDYEQGINGQMATQCVMTGEVLRF